MLWAADPAAYIARFIVPPLAGFSAVALHGIIRIPLNIPGHHGLEFMALLMGATLLAGRRQAGYLFSLGVGIGLPVFGLFSPLNLLVYLLPGAILGTLPAKPKRIALMALAGGLAYASIPMVRLILHTLAGIPFASFAKHGYILPLVNFFLFGLIGSLISLLAFKAFRSNP